MSIYVGLDGHDYVIETDGSVIEVDEDGYGRDVLTDQAAAVIAAACDADGRRRAS